MGLGYLREGFYLSAVRLIGHLKESSQAAAFGDFLFLEEIENEVEREDDGTYSIWVEDEEQLEDATRLLAEFQRNPGDKRYQDLEDKARARRTEKEKEARGRAPLTFNSRDTVEARRFGMGPVTGAMIAVSVVVFVVSRFGGDRDAIMSLFITAFEVKGAMIEWKLPSLVEVRQGQVWRLVTPIFIHFGVLHILFNMMWLRQLGSAMEHIQGRGYYLAFILISAAASNVGEFFIAHHPNFGGMSGVVFALFGFVWMKSKFDFMSGYAIDQGTVVLMVAWFFICFTGILPIANVVHSVGFGIGLVWGYLSATGVFRSKG